MHISTDGPKRYSHGQGLWKYKCQGKQFIKLFFLVEKSSSRSSGLLADDGIILAKAPSVSAEAKAHGQTNKYDATRVVLHSRRARKGALYSAMGLFILHLLHQIIIESIYVPNTIKSPVEDTRRMGRSRHLLVCITYYALKELHLYP